MYDIMTLGCSLLEIFCSQTDRQTDKQTNKQTNRHTQAITVSPDSKSGDN